MSTRSRLSDSQWLRLETRLEAFERAWKEQHGQPDIREFLDDADPECRERILLELIKLDIEYRAESETLRDLDWYEEQYASQPFDAQARVELEEEQRRVKIQFSDSPRAVALGASHFEPKGPPDLRSVGRYQIRECVGRGGFATIYRAWDPELDRDVALKLPKHEIASTAEGRKRILREAQSAARLHHPRIVPIHEVGEHDGCSYIVYEFISGCSLVDRMHRGAPRIDEAARLIMQIAEGLHYAHQCGVVHRDIKPANILLGRDGEPMLADFGLAHLDDVDSSLTMEGDILGTPAYMSPEQAKGIGTVGPTTDIYSLGVVFYELITGRRPFEGSGASLLLSVVHEEPPAPSKLIRSRGQSKSTHHRSSFPFRDVETICLKAMAKEPDRRYSSAVEMANDLKRFLVHEPIQARRTSAIGRLGLWCRRRPALASTMLLALIVIVSIAVFSYGRVLDERNRFLAEREHAEERLYDALMREAESLRLARLPGFKEQAFDRLRRAASLRTSNRDPAELRHEVVANMGDFVGLQPVTWNEYGEAGMSICAAHRDAANQVAIGFSTGVIRFYHRTTAETVQELQTPQDNVFGLVFSHDGSVMVAADDQGTLTIWNDVDGDWRYTKSLKTQPSSEQNYVHPISLFLSSDGSELIAASKSASAVSRFDITSGEKVGEFGSRVGDNIYRVAISPDGRRAAIVYYSEQLVVWDIQLNQIIAQADLQIGASMNVAYAPDAKHIAVTFKSGVAVYESESLSRLSFCRRNLMLDSAFLSDGTTLAVPDSSESTVTLWDTHNNNIVATLNHEGQPHTVSVSADGAFLVTVAAGSTKLWQLKGLPELRLLDSQSSEITSLAYDPKRRWLINGNGRGELWAWDVLDWKGYLLARNFGSSARAIDFYPTGDWFATGNDQTISIWDTRELPELSLVHSFPTRLGSTLWTLAISDSGDFIGAAGVGGCRIWRYGDATSGTGFDEVLQPTDDTVGSLVFSKDGNYVAFVDQSSRVRVWDILKRSEVKIQPLQGGINQGLAFDDSIRPTLFGIDRTGSIVGQNLASGHTTRLDEEWGHEEGWTYREIALGPDRTTLVHRGRWTSVWNMLTGERQFQLPATAGATSYGWHPNGTQIAIGLQNGEIQIWDLEAVNRQLSSFGL